MFYYILLISINQILINICNIKFSNYKNTINNRTSYQIVFNKLNSLINKKFLIFRKNIKIIF